MFSVCSFPWTIVSFIHTSAPLSSRLLSVSVHSPVLSFTSSSRRWALHTSTKVSTLATWQGREEGGWWRMDQAQASTPQRCECHATRLNKHKVKVKESEHFKRQSRQSNGTINSRFKRIVKETVRSVSVQNVSRHPYFKWDCTSYRYRPALPMILCVSVKLLKILGLHSQEVRVPETHTVSVDVNVTYGCDPTAMEDVCSYVPIDQYSALHWQSIQQKQWHLEKYDEKSYW